MKEVINFKGAVIKPWGFDVAVTGEAYPSESQRINDLDGGDPGFPAFASIDSVMVGGIDIQSMLTKDQWDYIEAELLRVLDIT